MGRRTEASDPSLLGPRSSGDIKNVRSAPTSSTLHHHEIIAKMSDAGRKSFTDKASESLKPESEKSYLEQAKEAVTDGVDKLAAKTTPNDQKSFLQTTADSAQQGHDDAKDAASHDKATLTETAEQYIGAAKETVANAAQYISGVVTGALEGAEKGAEANK